jgi:hypothetical protein
MLIPMYFQIELRTSSVWGMFCFDRGERLAMLKTNWNAAVG